MGLKKLKKWDLTYYSDIIEEGEYIPWNDRVASPIFFPNYEKRSVDAVFHTAKNFLDFQFIPNQSLFSYLPQRRSLAYEVKMKADAHLACTSMRIFSLEQVSENALLGWTSTKASWKNRTGTCIHCWCKLYQSLPNLQRPSLASF